MAFEKTSRKLQWVRAPLQRRSDESLRRILDASEALMEQKSFDDITVAEIVQKAHSSVGVFYSRFPDKLSLLHHLDERFTQEAEEAIARQLCYENWRGCSFAEASRELIDFLCRSHAEKRGMLKSVILQVRMHPNQRFQQAGKRLLQVVDRMAAFLLNWRQEISHPDPEQAIRLALLMVISAIRDLMVFSDTTMYQDLVGLDVNDLPNVLAELFHRMVTSCDRAPGS